MEKKSSAYYQRQFRERLRSQGLVKKEVWILPDHASTLSQVEEMLRNEALATELNRQLNDTTTADTHPYWTTKDLYDALVAKKAKFLPHSVLELITGNEPIIHIIMQDYGDLPVFVSVQGEQIIAETVLCTVDEINDIAGFNDIVLRTHKFLPLSTISLDTLSFELQKGESERPNERIDAYQMFGSVSSQASLGDIVIEIQMLCHNVMQALEIYSSFFITGESEWTFGQKSLPHCNLGRMPIAIAW